MSVGVNRCTVWWTVIRATGVDNNFETLRETDAEIVGAEFDGNAALSATSQMPIFDAIGWFELLMDNAIVGKHNRRGSTGTSGNVTYKLVHAFGNVECHGRWVVTLAGTIVFHVASSQGRAWQGRSIVTIVACVDEGYRRKQERSNHEQGCKRIEVMHG